MALAPRQPRPRRHRRADRRDRGHVRGPDRRAGDRRTRSSAGAAASVHARPARLDPARRRAAHRASDAHPGRAAERGQPAARLRVPSALRARPAVVPGACSGARSRRGGPPHRLPGREQRIRLVSTHRRDASAPLLRGRGPRQALPRARHAAAARHRRPRRRRRIVRDRAGRDAGPRRRDGLREVDGRAARDAAARADRRTHRVRGPRHHALVAAASCGRCAARCRSSSRIRTRR